MAKKQKKPNPNKAQIWKVEELHGRDSWCHGHKKPYRLIKPKGRNERYRDFDSAAWEATDGAWSAIFDHPANECTLILVPGHPKPPKDDENGS